MNPSRASVPSTDATPFIGRKDLIGKLRGELDRTLTGKGGMILVEGEAGIGKTRFIQEISADAEERGFNLLSGKCLDYRRSPLLPFKEMLRGFFGITQDPTETGDIDSLFSAFEKNLDIISKHKAELGKFLFPRSEPVGGYLYTKKKESEVIDFMVDRGYRTLIIGSFPGKDTEKWKKKGISIMSVGTGDAPELHPKRIENIARRIKDAFETYKHCAVFFNCLNEVSKHNPEVKIRNLIKISSSLSRTNGGVFLVRRIRKKGILQEGLPLLEPESFRDQDEELRENGSEHHEDMGQSFSTYELLLSFFRELSARSPVLMTVEDLQWGDKTTFNLLQFLARFAKEEKMLILGSYRSEEYHLEEDDQMEAALREALQRMSREHLFETMKLQRFSKEETYRMIDTLDKGSSPEFADKIWKGSQGNPLFIIELSKVESYEDVSKLEVEIQPPTAGSLISRRLNSLSEKEREVLELSAVMREMITLEGLGSILVMDEGSLLDIIDNLIELKFLKERDEDFCFEHTKVRESVYDQIDPGRRKEYHTEAARILESRLEKGDDIPISLLSDHYLYGGMLDKAVGALLETAKIDLESNAHEEALEGLGKALKCLNSLEDNNENMIHRIKAYQMQGDIHGAKGEIEDAIDSYENAVRISEERHIPFGLSTSYRRMGDLKLELLDWDQTIDLYLRSLHVSKQEDDQAEIAKAFKGLGTIYLLKGDYHRSLECYIKYMEFPHDRLGDIHVRAMIDMGEIYFQRGDFNQALTYFKLAIKKGEERKLLLQVALAYVKMANVLLKLGEVADALRYSDLALSIVIKNTTPGKADEVVLLCIDLMLECGELEKVEESMKLIEEEDGQSRDPLLQALKFRILGIYQARKRDFDSAVQSMESSIGLLESYQVPFQLALSYFHYGLIMFQQMEVDTAIELLNKAGVLFRDIRALHYLNRTSSKLREVTFIKEGLKV
ncbi:MAG: AAA family ATPase [Thermoplasmatota archaeon]